MAIWWGSTGAFYLGANAIVILFLTFFFLMAAEGYRARLVRLLGPHLSNPREASRLPSEISTQIERFVVVRIITAVIVGLVTWIALALLGSPQPAVWGLLSGLFNSIPFFGPVIVSGGLFLVGTFARNVTFGAKLALIAAIITSLEGWLLTPTLMGKAARMHALAVFIGLLVWSWIWGVWGTLLAVPLLAVIKAIADRVPAMEPLAVLLEE